MQKKKWKQTWTDDTEMPWGEHEGVKLKDVPNAYFRWLMDQPWLNSWPQIPYYIGQNHKRIYADKEDDDAQEEIGGYTSYQDFLDDR